MFSYLIHNEQVEIHGNISLFPYISICYILLKLNNIKIYRTIKIKNIKIILPGLLFQLLWFHREATLKQCIYCPSLPKSLVFRD